MSVTTDEMKNTAPVPMTEEQRNMAVKEFMYQEYLKKYQELCNLTNQTPFHPELRRLIAQHLDTAFLWAKEAFNALQMPADPIKEPDAPLLPAKRTRKKKKKAKNGK